MKRDLIRKIVSSQPHIKSKHGTPLSRRDLLGAGYLAVGGMVLMPNIQRILGDKAYAAADCGAVTATAAGGMNQSAVLLIDLSGGATLPFSFPPLDINGAPLSQGSYQTVGIFANIDPNNVTLDTTFGIPMNPASSILAGMKQALGLNDANAAVVANAAAMAAKVNGYISCVESGDDTQNNEHNLLMGLPKLGYSRLIGLLGDNDNANGSGGRSAPVADWKDPEKNPIIVKGPNDAINIVLPEVLKSYLPGDKYSLITDMAKTWSVSDQAYFMSLSESAQIEQIKRLADKECAFVQSGTLISRYQPDAVDVTKDTNAEFLGLWAANAGGTGPGQIVKLLADNIAVGGVISLGGFDYHGNGAQAQQAKDNECGLLLGRVIRSMCLKGKNCMVSIFTDGGTSSGTAGDAPANPATPNDPSQRIAQTNDSGNRSMRITFFINGAGTTRPEMTTTLKQIGAYNITGAVDKTADTLISASPAKAAAVDLVNLLKFDGNLDLAKNLDLPDVAKYGIMVETKPAT